jgi:hypothetical protein
VFVWQGRSVGRRTRPLEEGHTRAPWKGKKRKRAAKPNTLPSQSATTGRGPENAAIRGARWCARQGGARGGRSHRKRERERKKEGRFEARAHRPRNMHARTRRTRVRTRAPSGGARRGRCVYIKQGEQRPRGAAALVGERKKREKQERGVNKKKKGISAPWQNWCSAPSCWI